MTYNNPLKTMLRELVSNHISKTGMTQKEIAQAFGFENTNNLSMILSPNYSTNLSANRFAKAQEIFGLSDEQALQLFHAKAQIRETTGAKKSFGAPMDNDTMVYMLKLSTSSSGARL